MFLENTKIDEFVEKPTNVFYVAQDEDYIGSKTSLQCIFISPGEGINANHWDDCRNDTSCLESLSIDLYIWNDAYNVSYLDENGLVHYNLTVKNVTLSSAGTYQCRMQRNSNQHEAKGRMLVIGESRFKCKL